jgi:hypothetical protein
MKGILQEFYRYVFLIVNFIMIICVVLNAFTASDVTRCILDQTTEYLTWHLHTYIQRFFIKFYHPEENHKNNNRFQKKRRIIAC